MVGVARNLAHAGSGSCFVGKGTGIPIWSTELPSCIWIYKDPLNSQANWLWG